MRTLHERLEAACRDLGVPCLSVLRADPATCSSPISAPHRCHRAGAQHMLNADYFKRIDALNYHDDA